MNKQDFLKYNKYFMFKIFIGVFIFSLLVFFTFSMLSHNQKRNAELKSLEEREQLVVEGAKGRINDHVDFITTDLVLLKNEFVLALHQGDDFDHIAQDWLIYSNDRNLFTQIRFIDNTGFEKIRVNLDDNGVPMLVDNQDLQDKSDRYYFSQTINLPDESIYYSSMDLNIENGEIETPYSLEFRLSTPIYFEDVIQGVLVINFNSPYLFDHMPYYDEISEGDFYILNEDAYFLYHEDPSYLYGFDIAERSDYNLNSMYQDAWEHILSNDMQFLTDDGLFSVSTFNFEDAFHASNYAIHSEHEKLYTISFIDASSNQYLFTSHLLWHLFTISFLNGWYVIIILLVISAGLSSFIYIKAKLDSETKYYANVDPLCNQYNRKYGVDSLEKYISENKNVSICFIDLNGLKTINDTYGHQVGDEFIIEVTNIIEFHISNYDFIFRLGGDEFIIVTQKDVKYLENVWNKVLKTFDKINKSGERQYHLSASHGCISYNQSMGDVYQFITKADHMMYQEKEAFYKYQRKSSRP